MTGWPRAADAMDEQQRAGIVRALARWCEHQDPEGTDHGDAPNRHAVVVDMELLREGRPGLLDVVAEIGDRLAHVVFALHRTGEELRLLGTVEEPALGVIEDADGFAVVVDAVHDLDASQLLLDAVAGEGVRGRPHSVVTVVHDGAEATTLGFDRRFTFTVFPWLRHGPHPGVALLAGLDEAGFNHLAAPVAFWRRAGRDLGVVQELVAGAAGGWALALTSLRDLFAGGLSPDTAGGDFAPESFALGTMTARMHLALERAFGRRDDAVSTWVDALQAALSGRADEMTAAQVLAVHLGTETLGRGPATRPNGHAGDPLAARGATVGAVPSAVERSVHERLEELRSSGLRVASIRTHGDFHLGRTARTDHGWVVSDTMPGGSEPGSDDPVFRPPLADVADFLWSLRYAAAVAASERGPAAEASRVGELAEAWSARNRRAFLAAYLAAPGIDGLVPSDRQVVRQLAGAFEAARALRRPTWARAAN